ncbi:hypothetical protein GCM10020358_72490 [Amorphoplanes nipponensis]|uniref:Uncharacterized protein n=1 Tax=Actinoplanes nipponensis TaxID=135950 RepID=A0A919JHP0_9ACTN|nr:hypothetical protein Ani05nite_32010 [Actinoplanes nipponensis]
MVRLPALSPARLHACTPARPLAYPTAARTAARLSNCRTHGRSPAELSPHGAARCASAGVPAARAVTMPLA